MKRVMITQSNYIPWKGWFDSLNLVDELILYDDMQYTKRDWRNRNMIKTREGTAWLTIPVEVKGNFFQKIKETKIADLKWREQHWKSLVHNYSKAPFFPEYKSRIEEAFMGCTEEFLSQVNLRFILMINDLLGIRIPVKFSSEFSLAEGKTERLVGICEQAGATEYFTGPASKNYMDESLFSAKGIGVHYLDYSGYPEYPQLHGKFEHAVTVLDLILNTGPEAPNFMKNFKH